MSTFYSMTQIVAKTGLSAHTLRYYEKIGLMDSVARNAASHRRYNDDDVRWIEFLQRLRSTHMSIQQMLHYAQLRRLGSTVDSLMERRTMLDEHARQLHAEIAHLQETLTILDDKIITYDQILTQVRGG